MANQSVIDPRQALTIANYRNPLSETFGNLKQSLIRAGYQESYAHSIYDRNLTWLSQGMIADVELVKESEKNLDYFVRLKIPILKGKDAIDLAKLKVDVSKFVLKTLARQKYSEDKEQVTPNVQINIVNYSKDKAKVVDGTPVQDTVVNEVDTDGKATDTVA